MNSLIKNGTIVTATRSYRADLKISGGKIVEIAESLNRSSGGDAERLVDATDCYIMPGGIDPHTHLNMPFMGTHSADDYESGTRAGLAGGTTMVVDFCIPSRDQPLLEALADWQARSVKAVSDFSWHMCITYWNEQVREDMAKIVSRGVNSFKHFMAYKGALMVDDEEMFASFQRCAEIGALPLVHAENGEVVAALQQQFLARGWTGPEAHAASRPPEVEGEAANRAILIARTAGVPLYIVHTSSIPAHEAIQRARALGQRVYGEPLIQHLILDESEYANPSWEHAARRVMSPPFRDKSHQEDLWNGLRAGSLQVVATDHCSFTTEQKTMGRHDFTRIPNGTGGLEDRMPLLWTHGVNSGRLTMNEFVAVTSTNSARILNIYPQKGAIELGSDADLVIWDPRAEKTISAATQQSVIDYNVFEGYAVKGLPRYSLSRGEICYQDGKVDARPGRGKFVPRPAFTPEFRAAVTRKKLTDPQPVERYAVTP
ncbi:MAG: dihydropyrimidinase [Candidatus Pacebacteria bacterium]|nr:dihydropyrimidinase [Candidatus Paceibacterota bacterium]